MGQHSAVPAVLQSHIIAVSVQEEDGTVRKTKNQYSWKGTLEKTVLQETAETVKKGKTVSKTTHTYSYAAKGWKDQLLSYKTTTVTYDRNGKENKTVST